MSEGETIARRRSERGGERGEATERRVGVGLGTSSTVGRGQDRDDISHVPWVVWMKRCLRSLREKSTML